MDQFFTDLYNGLQAFGLFMIFGVGFVLWMLFIRAITGVDRRPEDRPAAFAAEPVVRTVDVFAAPAYQSLEQLVAQIDGPNGLACLQLLNENRALFETVQGSAHNHQNWPGGYVDHVTDGMNVAVTLYRAYSALRPLPFTLSDALLVFYLHDIEKPWKYEIGDDGQVRRREGLKTKAEAHAFRAAKLAYYGIQLTDEQQNGLRYVEGEMDDYSNTHRVMGPLAAFCHAVDVTSARLWFDHPFVDGDPWQGSERRRTNK